MDPREKNDEAVLPLTGHLEEFRRRLIYCLIALTLASGASYAYIEDIIAFISAPAGKLYFMQPAEVFFSYLHTAVFTGFLVTMPVWAFQLWCFIRPALTDKERHWVLFFVPAAVLLFYGGMAFSYFLVLPAAIQFFMDFSSPSLQPMFSLSAYLSFFMSFTLPFGLAFVLPLVLLILSRLGLVTPQGLRRKRKAFIVLDFIFAAVISPTGDAFTQTMIAVPVLILYEGSIWIMKWLDRNGPAEP